MRPLRIAAAAGALVVFTAFAGIGLPAVGETAEAEPARQVIEVNGAGLVTTVPDRAVVSFGVQSRGETAAVALQRNSAEALNVIEALRDAGVARNDIQTQNVSLHATYGSEMRVTGYIAWNNVIAKIRDIDRAGRVIDRAVAAGANVVYGPWLRRSDSEQLYRSALKAAVATARAKAQAIASASGIRLGRVTSVREHGFGYPGGGTVGGTTGIIGNAPGPPIQPGSQEITATVGISFAIVR